MLNIERWIDGFSDLNPVDQLEIAEAILDELDVDMEDFITDDEDELADETEALSEVFTKLIERLNKKKEANEKLEKIRRFKDLSLEHQDEVLHYLIKCIDETYQKQEQEEKEAVCEKEGHLFTKWKYDSWQTYGDVMIDHELVQGYESLHEEWARVCKRCGYKEVTEIEPAEAKEERIEREKQEKIKKLEKELKRLKGK